MTYGGGGRGKCPFSIIGFSLKGPPKWGFGGILGVGAKIFGGNPLRMQRPPTYAFSGNLVQI